MNSAPTTSATPSRDDRDRAPTPAQSLARGAAGTALLHVERAWAGLEDWRGTHRHIRRATDGPIDASPSAGLYQGAPAVAFLLRTAAARHSSYQAAADTLDDHVLRMTRHRLTAATDRAQRGQRTTFGEYDLFSGLTGLGAMLLHTLRGDTHHRSLAADTLADVLRYLVGLTHPVRRDGLDLPGWWTDHAPDTTIPTPGGHANLGTAHGAAGLLALLALAARAGHIVAGHHDAIRCLTDWFDRWRQDSTHGPWWPQWITRDELTRNQTAQPTPGRPSWCYGAVGIARALQLAAIATHESSRQTAAEAALAANLSDHALNRVTDRGICHGLAGIYQTAYRAAQDETQQRISPLLPRIAHLLAARATPTRDEDGILTGAPGIALAQHTAADLAAPRTGWDACLLIT